MTRPTTGKREFESIDKLVDRWLKANRVSDRIDREAIYARWPEVVGESIAAYTRVVDLRGDVLHVEVGSAALLQELSTYYRDEILESIRRFDDFANVRDVRFRAGSVSQGTRDRRRDSARDGRIRNRDPFDSGDGKVNSGD